MERRLNQVQALNLPGTNFFTSGWRPSLKMCGKFNLRFDLFYFFLFLCFWQPNDYCLLCKIITMPFFFLCNYLVSGQSNGSQTLFAGPPFIS